MIRKVNKYIETIDDVEFTLAKIKENEDFLTKKAEEASAFIGKAEKAMVLIGFEGKELCFWPTEGSKLADGDIGYRWNGFHFLEIAYNTCNMNPEKDREILLNLSRECRREAVRHIAKMLQKAQGEVLSESYSKISRLVKEDVPEAEMAK